MFSRRVERHRITLKQKMKTWKVFSINFFILLDSLALTRETHASIVNVKHCEGEENT